MIHLLFLLKGLIFPRWHSGPLQGRAGVSSLGRAVLSDSEQEMLSGCHALYLVTVPSLGAEALWNQLPTSCFYFILCYFPSFPGGTRNSFPLPWRSCSLQFFPVARPAALILNSSDGKHASRALGIQFDVKSRDFFCPFNRHFGIMLTP